LKKTRGRAGRPPIVLVSGFDAFGAHKVNPSALVALSLHGVRVRGAEIRSVVLPTSFRRAFPTLRRAIRTLRPRLVISLGLAPNRRRLTVERIAVNVMDARIADNDDYRPVDRAVVARGPDGILARVPLRAMARAARRAGAKCDVSNSAGTYVCNAVMYRLLAEARAGGFAAGFVHLPPAPKAGARMARAIRAIAGAALAQRGNRPSSG